MDDNFVRFFDLNVDKTNRISPRNWRRWKESARASEDDDEEEEVMLN
jgi:hypothetical protein